MAYSDTIFLLRRCSGVELFSYSHLHCLAAVEFFINFFKVYLPDEALF